MDDSDNIKFNWKRQIQMMTYFNLCMIRAVNLIQIISDTSTDIHSIRKLILRINECIGNYLKNLHAKVFDEDIDNFVEDGVCKLCRYTDDRKFFKAVVDVESASHKDVSLTDIMFLHIHENIKILSLSFHLIKKMYKDIVFDEDKVRVAIKDGKSKF